MAKKNKLPDLAEEFSKRIQPRVNDSYPPNSYPPQYQYPPQVAPQYAETQIQQEKEGKKRKKNLSRIAANKESERKEDIEHQYIAGQRSRLVVRSLLIILNFSLLVYFVFSATTFFLAFNRFTPEAYITLAGRTKKDSKRIYESFLKIDGSEEISDPLSINDYAIAGEDLYLSGLKISLNKLTSFSNVFYTNVAVPEVDFVTMGSTSNHISLDRLEDGTYLLHPDKTTLTSRIGRINTNEIIYKTFLTLPKENGERKKITIHNNAVTPGLVIDVKTTTTEPSDQYDVALLVDDKKTAPKLPNYFKVLVCDKIEGLACIYKGNPLYAFDLGGEKNISSYFAPDRQDFTKDTLHSDGPLIGLSKTDFIRETGGYITSSGSGRDATSLEVRPFLRDWNNGSKSYVIDKKITDKVALILSVMKR